ncbi:MAG: hypothetical protein DRO67_08595 [Candidatus Asgardarchaeum californiense]|nr:MAG: hypothetical protein DRO67_08595 [Candidatus Asgardarchaeum californiense]
MIVRIIFVCLISFAAAFPQKVDERLLLIEAQKLITYMESFDEMANKYTDVFIVSNITNVAQSVSRSMNILINVYHLIHIHNIIQGAEDKQTVGNYVYQQLPKLSRLLKIERKITNGMLSSVNTKEIKDVTTLYISSLNYIINTLDTSVE